MTFVFNTEVDCDEVCGCDINPPPWDLLNERRTGPVAGRPLLFLEQIIIETLLHNEANTKRLKEAF